MLFLSLAALGACGTMPRPPEPGAQAAPGTGAQAAPETGAQAAPETGTAEMAPPPVSPVRPVLPARPTARPVSAEEKRRSYTRYIVRNYKVRRELADQITRSAWVAGDRFKLPPTLLLAIMAVESSYDPKAFNGTDVGLMQINPLSHPEKVARVGGPTALYEVDKNIFVGAWALREWRNRSHTMAQALRGYSGSKTAGSTYPQRVEAQRLALENNRPPHHGSEPSPGGPLTLSQARH
jgi:soluble lytic murein transglycosylase-like protein